MAEKKFKYSRPVTPIGIAKFCWVDKPDTGHDGKSNPKYKSRILIDDTEENRAWCEEMHQKALAEAKKAGVKIKKVHKTPFQYPEDQDEDDFIPAEGKDKPKLDEDHKGRIFFEAKTAFQPGLIDCSSPPQSLPEGARIMGGDKIRLKIEFNPYEGLGSGISFRLVTVQLIEKNSAFAGGGVDTDGFGEVDGGYTAPDTDDEDGNDEKF